MNKEDGHPGRDSGYLPDEPGAESQKLKPIDNTTWYNEQTLEEYADHTSVPILVLLAK